MENDNGEHNVDPINFGQEGNPPNEDPVDGPLYPNITNKPPTYYIPNFNITSELSKDDVVVDQELDDLLSSFQLLSDKNDDEGIDNERQLRKTRELIGFSFDQKTKSEVFDDFSIRSLWSKPYIDYEYSSSVGASSGILSMWDNRFFSLEQKFSHRNFVGTIRSWVGISVKVGFINVYAPQDSILKNNLWADIENLVNSVNVVWIIFGDFNVVRCAEERAGSLFDLGEANSFNDFISRVGLVDIPLNYRSFTRFDRDGKKASKLDRYLVSNSFFNSWKDVSVSVLCCSFSDRWPILLKVGLLDFGPRPFKVFEKWVGNC
ncbi:RNA-directed DNA polymerase, eukaryota [Tanacetum coccineum]